MAHITIPLHPILTHLTLITASNLVVRVFSLNFRLHTSLGRETWAKLWYCCRALDQQGRGCIKFPVEMLEILTGGDEKSIYRWLKDGRRWGAFRAYSCKKGILSIWMRSLSKCCIRLNLKDWGAVSVQNLLELKKLRALTTATLTQKLQQKSRYAASRKIDPKYKKAYGLPHPNQIVPDARQSSLKMPPGQVPFVLHVSDRKVFVSKGFLAFGTAQRTIAEELLIHPITIQRHQKAAGMDKRQLIQGKQFYAWVKLSLVNGSPEYYVDEGQAQHIGYSCIGTSQVSFEDGIPYGSKKSIPNSWECPLEGFSGRFFKMGKNWWMAKCNIYREDYELKAMWAARYEHRASCGTVPVSEESSRPGGRRL